MTFHQWPLDFKECTGRKMICALVFQHELLSRILMKCSQLERLQSVVRSVISLLCLGILLQLFDYATGLNVQYSYV